MRAKARILGAVLWVFILGVALWWASPAWSQNITFLPSGCGTGRVTGAGFLTVDSTGILCTSSSGGGGGGLSVIDQAAWTQGASAFTPTGGVFNDTATLSSGQEGTARVTTKRAFVVDVDSSGSQLHSDLIAPIAAGTNIMGKVGIDQTTPGTTNGAAIVGVNAATALAGNGATGTGSLRVTVANDNTIPTGWPTAANQTAWQSATGAAPPANAAQIGVNGSGATGGFIRGVIGCDASAIYDASTNGSTELVALTSGRTVYICGYSIIAGGTVNVKLITGTGTACATGSANITPAYQLTAQVGIADGAPFYRGLKGASASAVCINTSAGVAAQAIIYYSII